MKLLLRTWSGTHVEVTWSNRRLVLRVLCGWVRFLWPKVLA